MASSTHTDLSGVYFDAKVGHLNFGVNNRQLCFHVQVEVHNSQLSCSLPVERKNDDFALLWKERGLTNLFVIFLMICKNLDRMRQVS